MLEINFGMATQCLLLLLAAVLVRIWLSSRDLYVKGSRLPGPPALPLIGNLLQFANNDLDVVGTISHLATEYDGFFRLWIANKLLVVMADPEHLQTFYTSTALLDRADMYGGIAEILGHDSIFVVGGEKWKKLRKMLMLTFNPTPTADLLKNFNECNEYLMGKFRDKADNNIFKAFIHLRVTMSMAILKNALGRSESEEMLTWAVEEAEYLAKVAYIRQFSPMMHYNVTFYLMPEGRRFRKSCISVQNWIEGLVLERKQVFNSLKKNGEPIPNIYIFNMLDKFGDFPLAALRNELMNLLVTGLDTLAGTCGFVLIVLALYPDLQEQILLEDQQIQNAASGREVDVDDMQKYELLERVIKETLRIFPVGPLIGRKVPEDTYFGKYLVPKGTNVGVNAMYTYRNPEIFANPLKFDPDRFLPENVKKRHPYSFNPFSAGPRACPGMKYAMIALKVFVPGVVRHFKIGCKYTSLDEAMKSVVAEVTLTDINHYPLKLAPRHSIS